jgi:hypothetical protein
MLLEGKPLSDLLAAEEDLTSTVANIEEGIRVLGLDFASDAKSTAARGGYGTAGFITARRSTTSY